MDETRRAWSAAYGLTAAGSAGASVLALEVVAARTMAPAVGTGSVAWAALLAVALGSLAVGNLVGGLLADRRRRDGPVVWALTIAAVGLSVLPHVYGPAMRWAADQRLLTGSLAAAAITQGIPMLLLGVITPVLVKGRGGTTRGPWAGAVLAAGSAGGIAGALATGLTLLPAVGLSRSYLLIGVVLALTALPAALLGGRWLAIALAVLVLAAAAVSWFARPPDGVVQSPYGQIEVREEDGARVLLVDGLPQTGMPERIVPWEGLMAGYPLELALLQPYRPETALVIGLGAGLAPRILEAHGVRCETVELDPAVAEIARREFGFSGQVIVADGRRFLERTDRRWDLIVIDVCTSEQLAWHLFTREAFTLARRRLNPGGVLAVQFIGDDGRWSASVLRTAQEAGNCTLVAPRWALSPVGPRRLFAGDTPFMFPPEGSETSADRPAPWRVVRPDPVGYLLTDDHFPAAHDWSNVARLWRRLSA